MVNRYISTVEELDSYLTSKGLVRQAEQVHLPKTLPLRIPKSYLDLIDWSDPHDPLTKMVLPDAREQHVHDYELIDPIGDTSHEPVPGLIHRYPDRCLLLFTTHCGVHCRFCFRREYVGKPRPIDIPGCIEYMRTHREINEAIFSGGDPMTFPQGFLLSILTKLATIEHLRMVRFHTRLAVMDPASISTQWLQTLHILGDRQKIVVLHINHPREITHELQLIVAQMKKQSITVLAQTVLLSGVNDSTEILKDLFVGLAAIGVVPYYLHHLDFARGTHHFRVSVKRGMEIYSALRGQISGYMIPEYVIDLPGGDGKYPVMWMKELGNGKYEARTAKNGSVVYTDPSMSLLEP